MSNKTILLVEDESVVADYIKDLLEDEGYEVITAKDGQDGIETYEEHEKAIDLVLLDLVMPVKNGQDCFSGLIKINPEVKVILLSGYTREAGVDYLYQKGVKAFLRKPFMSTMLLQKIEEFI